MHMLHRMGSSEQKVKKIRVKCRNLASITLPCDFIKSGLHHRHFPKNVPIFLRDSHFVKHVLATAITRLYLFSEPDNYYFGRASQEQQSKCT